MKKDFFNLTVAHTFYGVISKLTSIFGVVFFYKIFDNTIFYPLIIFGIIFFSHSILVLILVRYIGRFGARNSSILGMILFTISFLFLFLFDEYRDSLLLIGFLITHIFAKSFYHLPSHIFRLRSIHINKIGSKMGSMRLLWDFVGLVTPLIGGIFSEFFGSLGLVILSLSASIPSIVYYMKLPNYKFDFTLKFEHLFRERSYIKIFETTFVHAFTYPLMFVWSIWVFVQVGQGFSGLGNFTSAIMLISILAIKLFGKFLDSHNKKEAFFSFTLVRGIEFVMKFFSFNQIVLVISDIYGRVARGVYSVAYDAYLYGWVDHHEQKELLDERAAAAEFEVNIQIAFFFLIVAILYNFFGINSGFLIFGIGYIVLYIIMKVFNSK